MMAAYWMAAGGLVALLWGARSFCVVWATVVTLHMIPTDWAYEAGVATRSFFTEAMR